MDESVSARLECLQLGLDAIARLPLEQQWQLSAAARTMRHEKAFLERIATERRHE